MPIDVRCANCGTKVRAPDSAAGKTKRCPKCGAPLPIPAPAATDAEPEPDINLYELAVDTAPPDPGPSAPDSVVIKQPAKKAPSKQAPAGLGHYAEAIASEMKKDEPATRGPLISIAGIDLTIPRLIGLAVVLIGLAFVGVWWTTLGPGRTHAVLDVQAVYATPVLASGKVIEPYSMVTMEGDMAAGVKGAPGALGPAGQALGALPGGEIMTVGSSDHLVVTRPDNAGDHLLIQVELSQSLMSRLGQTSRYDMVFRANEFGLQPADGSMPVLRPLMLYADFEGRADIDIAGTSATDPAAILPPGAPPSSEQLERDGNRVSGGTLYYNGSAGIRGDVDFNVFPVTPGIGGGGFSADGDLKLTDAGGSVVDMQYQGSQLTVSWNAGSQGHWARDNFTRKEGNSPFTKYTVGLLFERPYTDQPLKLTYAGKTIGTLGKHHNAPTPAAATSTNNPLAYFDMLTAARDKTRGLVAQSNMRQLAIALKLYVDQNQGQLPDRLDDLRTVMPDLDAILLNQRTGENPGFVYIKPADHMDDIDNPADTVLLYESNAGRADPDGAKFYADGRLEPAS